MFQAVGDFSPAVIFIFLMFFAAIANFS